MATIPQDERGDVRPAPRLGQHTDEVLADVLGMSGTEIGRLHDAGVVAGRTADEDAGSGFADRGRAGRRPVAAADYRAPRNALGQPDLQGVWNTQFILPIEARPDMPSLTCRRTRRPPSPAS